MTLIILASTSPFRKQLLEKLQLPFITADPQVAEQYEQSENPSRIVQRLAHEKALAVATSRSDGIIIGSDQLAVSDNRILGKPGSHANAVEQLKFCSAKAVVFMTGLALIDAKSGQTQLAVEYFKVHFRKLSQAQIERYLHKETPYNCAGSFKSEGLGIALFERLEGDDPNTLIGLPLIRLVSMLEQAGINVLEEQRS